MFDIINKMPKGMNKGAYSGNLNCPREECQSRAIRYVENVSEYRLRYRCRKCGRTFQYDISGIAEGILAHPYAPYKKSKWRRYVEGWALTKGRIQTNGGIII
jgi:transposase-like protein